MGDKVERRQIKKYMTQRGKNPGPLFSLPPGTFAVYLESLITSQLTNPF